MSRDVFVTNGARRAEAGCVVSFENADGKTFSVHRVGPLRQALRECCEIAVQLDPSFRIVSYSNPATIYADLAGRGTAAGNTTPPTVELTVASAAGVRRMVHPRIIARSEEKIDESKQRQSRARWAAP